MRSLLVAAGLLALVACRVGSSTGTGGPPAEGEPELINATDDFYFRWPALEDLTENRQYSWATTGTRASVAQTGSGVTSSDSVKLIIRNGSGVEVYRGDLRVIGNFQSATLTPGTYTIRLELRNTSGTIDFRVMKSS